MLTWRAFARSVPIVRPYAMVDVGYEDVVGVEGDVEDRLVQRSRFKSHHKT